MHLVALLALRGTLDDEVGPLAADLKCTAFEARQRLAAGFPSVLQRLATPEAAEALAASLRARGHDARCVDPATLPVGAMFQVRDVTLEPDAVRSGRCLAFADLTALIRAVVVGTAQSTDVTRERKFSLGRAVLSQGLVMTRQTERTTVSVSQEKEAVLYVFSKHEAPWCFAEGALRYTGLGAALKPVRLENFETVVRSLRAGAPQARFDDRLVRAKLAPSKERANFLGRQTQSGNHETVELMACLLAMV
jgi:hypothetical protein